MQSMKEEKYNWSATLSAPKEYPMEIYQGNIIAEDYNFSFDMIWGTQNTGWGNQGGDWAGSQEKKEIPHKLEFTWFSLVEKKFYTGKWNVDKDAIIELFKEGVIDTETKKQTTYDTFVIGLAPKGRVVLWAMTAGWQKEVGVFQAHDTIIDKQKAYENARYMFKEGYAERTLNDDFYIKPVLREKIKKYGYPDPHIYDVYREKYDWKPVVESPSVDIPQVFVEYFNGEYENIFGGKFINNSYDYQNKATPKSVALIWNPDDKKQRKVIIVDFDEKEILQSFEKLGKQSPINMIFKVNNDYTRCTITLKNKEQEQVLLKSVVKD